MRVYMFGVISSLAAVSGCYLFHPFEGGSGSSVGQEPPALQACSTRSYKAFDQVEPVDMVWVVDSSQSMQDEQARIRQTINEFVADVAARQFDVHLVMITRDDLVPPPLGSDQQRYLFVKRTVGSHEPLIALVEELPRYRDFLRAGATLHFVAVTDDDSSLSADDFMREMNMRLGRSFALHAVASPDVDGQPCIDENASCDGANPQLGHRSCGAAAIGRAYYSLAERTGGEEISICVADWSEVFGPLLAAVGRSEIPCVVDVPARQKDETRVSLHPGSANSLELQRVDAAAQCGPQPAYYFDAQAGLPSGSDAARLVLCPAACTLTRTPDVELQVVPGCSTPDAD
jgi:hypothetical protein